MTKTQITEKARNLNPLTLWDRFAFRMAETAVEALVSDLTGESK